MFRFSLNFIATPLELKNVPPIIDKCTGDLNNTGSLLNIHKTHFKIRAKSQNSNVLLVERWSNLTAFPF